jgi:cyclic beta-1,2-glucan synthetase
VAGDVYSQPPYVGRGGWSWYTGAAGWLHRAAIESIFGLDLRADTLRFLPCLPLTWPEARLCLRRDGRVLHFHLRQRPLAGETAGKRPDAKTLAPGEALAWRALQGEHHFSIPLDPGPTPPGGIA